MRPAPLPAPACWAMGPQTDDGCDQTCMLPDGHTGPHQWTRDDEIVVSIPLALPFFEPEAAR